MENKNYTSSSGPDALNPATGSQTGQIGSGTKTTEKSGSGAKLADKLVQSSDGSAHFNRSLESVYRIMSRLVEEANSAPNTKKEIKILISELKSATNETVKWGRLTGRVPKSVKNVGCQTEARGNMPTPPSDAISALQEAMKLQGEAIGNLAQQVEKVWDSQRKHHEQKPRGRRDIIGTSQSIPGTRLEEGQNKAPPNMEHQVEAWTKVVKRRQAKTAADAKVAKQRLRQRPPAIMVDVGAEDFPALARKIRSGANREITGSHVTAMRQARSGGLLIEVRGDSAQVEAVRAEVARSAGPEVAVRTMVTRSVIEVRDLDEWTTNAEIVEAVAAAAVCGKDDVKVLNLRKLPGGAQTAIVLAPPEVARKVLGGRLRVGMVSCRVRVREERTRCFRCLAFGHLAKDCTGADRSGCCWSCGDGGHKAAACSATAESKKEFANALGGSPMEDSQPPQ